MRKGTLVRAFERAGHDVHLRDVHSPHWKRRLSKADIVIAVGGDGTVAKVAIAIAKKGKSAPPLAVIPSGKANNIARALGASRSPARLAGALRQGPNARLAIGLIRSPWGKARFVEAAGIGPLSSLLRTEIATLRGAASHMRQAIRNAQPHALRVRLDRVELPGDYLMVYALNINAIGPRLELAPDANPGDDRLDVLLVTRDQRVTRRARRVEIAAWPARGAGSVDDKLWPDEKSPKRGTVRIEIETTIPVLVPGA